MVFNNLYCQNMYISQSDITMWYIATIIWYIRLILFAYLSITLKQQQNIRINVVLQTNWWQNCFFLGIVLRLSSCIHTLCHLYALQNPLSQGEASLSRFSCYRREVPLGRTCLGAWFRRTTCHRGMGGGAGAGTLQPGLGWECRVRYAQPVFCCLPPAPSTHTLPCCGHVTCASWPAVGPWLGRLLGRSPPWAEEERITWLNLECGSAQVWAKARQVVVEGFSFVGLVWF